MAEQTSRQKVEHLHKQGKSAKDIADALDMSQANVYAHLRKISAEAGEAPRKRGRPPKVQAENGKAETKAEGKPATRPAPGKAAPKAATAKVAEANGKGAFAPHLLEALDDDLAEARKTVAKLERMREVLVG